MPPAGERTLSRIDVNLAVDRNDLGLQLVFGFLEVALILRLKFAAALAVQVFVQYVPIVEIPASTAERSNHTQNSGRDEPWESGLGEAHTGRCAVVGTTPRERNREDSQ